MANTEIVKAISLIFIGIAGPTLCYFLVNGSVFLVNHVWLFIKAKRFRKRIQKYRKEEDDFDEIEVDAISSYNMRKDGRKNMTTIIALSGKTSSGKDSAAKFVKDKYEIEPIVSYTTRPIRCNELNGREHYFVNDEEMDKIITDKDSLLAFVQFPKTGYRYCASTKDISDGTIKTYIIDPIGLKWLRENRPDVKVISIFFELSEDIIKERALKRGDNIDAIEKRLDSERDMFDEFARSQEYDVRIDTNDTPEAVNNAIAAALKLFGIE